MKELAKIVGEVLNIHEDPINDKNVTIELTMAELLKICNKWKISDIKTFKFHKCTCGQQEHFTVNLCCDCNGLWE
jgi:hypothetical protein